MVQPGEFVLTAAIHGITKLFEFEDRLGQGKILGGVGLVKMAQAFHFGGVFATQNEGVQVSDRETADIFMVHGSC